MPFSLQNPTIKTRKLNQRGYRPDLIGFSNILLDNTAFLIQYDVPTYINSYTRYPQTLFSGISQIGGFLAFLKILLIGLYFFNRYWFERRLKKINEDFKERYSIENLDKIFLEMK